VPPESRDLSKVEARAPGPSAEPAGTQIEPSAGISAVARNFVTNQGLAIAPAVEAEFAARAEPAAPPAPAVETRAATREPNQSAPFASASAWPSVVDRLRNLEPRWAAMYEHGVPNEVSAARVVVVFPEGSFFGRQAQTPGGSDALRRAASEVFGGSPEIVIKLASEVRGQSLAQTQAKQLDERKEGIKKRALSHPRVLEALKVFPELAQKQDVQVD
jgi:hypothetical protein